MSGLWITRGRMNTLTKIFSLLRSLFRRSALEREMAEEMRAHLEMQERANRDEGMDAEEARYAAQRQFGGLAQVQERCREQRGWRWAEDLLRDLRFAGRGLRRSPGFAAAVVLSLALCIGANTAVFSMLYALVLRPLPFSGASRLVEIYNTFPKVGMAKLASNVGQYRACRESIPELETVALWRLDECTLDDGRGPTRLSGAVATAEIFDLLHVRPLLGSFFTGEQQVPTADNVVVLTESLWESQFQRDPAVIGRKLRLDGKLCEIIGVAPRSMEAFDARVRLVRPLSWDHNQSQRAWRQRSRSCRASRRVRRRRRRSSISRPMARACRWVQCCCATISSRSARRMDGTGAVRRRAKTRAAALARWFG